MRGSFSVKSVVRRILAVAVSLLFCLTSCQQQPLPPPDFTLTVTPEDTEVVNSQKGMYQWLGVPSPIPDWQTVDVYWRDQIQWGKQIEKRRGVYDFSVFERGMQQAEQTKGRFSFRIMSLCPGCGGNLTPNYVPRQANGAPDWNSEEFLSGFENLMRKLGERYDNDPRLGIVDIGAYGLAGEWYCEKDLCGEPITDANVERLLRSVSKAFPTKYLVIGFAEQPAKMAAKINPRIGVRWDCVGGSLPVTLGYLPNSLQDVWRRAPVVGEWCNAPDVTATQGVDNVRNLHLSMLSSGNFPKPYDQLAPGEQAAFRRAYILSGYRYAVEAAAYPKTTTTGTTIKIAVTIKNFGSAPTYDAWEPRLSLLDPERRLVAESILAIDLRSLAEGSTTGSTEITVPADLAKGNYEIDIQAVHSQSYLAPLAFANPGRDKEGRHAIGRIVVTS